MAQDANDIREGDEITLRMEVWKVRDDYVLVTWPKVGSWERLDKSFIRATRIDAPRDTVGSVEDEAAAGAEPQPVLISPIGAIAALRATSAPKPDVDAAWARCVAEQIVFDVVNDDDVDHVRDKWSPEIERAAEAIRAGRATIRSGTDAGARGRAIEECRQAADDAAQNCWQKYYEGGNEPSTETMRVEMLDAIRVLASAPAPTRTDDTVARLVGLLEEAKPYVDMWSRPGIGHNSEKLCSTIDAALAELRAGESRR